MRVGFLIFASFFLAFGTAAQNFRPFTTGRTYHYRAPGPVGRADTIYTFRVDSTYILPTGEQAFCFNRTSSVDFAGPIFSSGRPIRLNFFGGWMRWHDSTGVATFASTYTSQTAVIRTREPVGGSWAFTPTVQATVVSRQYAPAMGLVDSVLTIALSDGQQLRISQHYGFLDGPSLTRYLVRLWDAPVTKAHHFSLDALPELGIPGITPLTWRSIYDLQPGDSLFFAHHSWSSSMSIQPVCPPDYDRRGRSAFAVLSQQLVPTGDTLVFQISYFTSARSGAPQQLRVPFQPPLLTYAQYDLTNLTCPGQYQVVLPALMHPDTLLGLPKVTVVGLVPDYGCDRSFAPGLGSIREGSGGGVYCSQGMRNRLIGCIKNNGAVRWENTTAPPAPAGLSAEAPALVATLAPNPADTDVLLTFSTEQPQTALLALYDGLGREIWQQEKVLMAGEQHLPINTAHQAPGLYHLRLTLADGRQRLLPLVRE